MQTPIPEYLTELLDDCAGDTSGATADYIPELGEADPNRLALALCTPDGTVYSVGDNSIEFTIQSISKPFAYALALRDRGMEEVDEHVGVEPSGDPFNEISVDPESGRPRNPMINIGAITTHCLVGNPSLTTKARAGWCSTGSRDSPDARSKSTRACTLSEYSTRYRNVALASMARSNGFIDIEPDDAVWGYTMQCSALVTVRDLSVMAMTLALGGRNPVTGEQVVPQWVCRQVLSVMTTCGMHDAAGDWLSHVGIPAKSGSRAGCSGRCPVRWASARSRPVSTTSATACAACSCASGSRPTSACTSWSFRRPRSTRSDGAARPMTVTR